MSVSSKVLTKHSDGAELPHFCAADSYTKILLLLLFLRLIVTRRQVSYVRGPDNSTNEPG